MVVWPSVLSTTRLLRILSDRFQILAGKHAEFLLETFGEVFRRVEAHTHGELCHTDAWLLLEDMTGLFQTDSIDEARHVLTSQSTQLIIERR